jgi:hypothetical protein
MLLWSPTTTTTNNQPPSQTNITTATNKRSRREGGKDIGGDTNRRSKRVEALRIWMVWKEGRRQQL